MSRTREREKPRVLPLQRGLIDKMWPIPTYCKVRDRAEVGDDLPVIMPEGVKKGERYSHVWVLKFKARA